jgi:hypothetical protein
MMGQQVPMAATVPPPDPSTAVERKAVDDTAAAKKVADIAAVKKKAVDDTVAKKNVAADAVAVKKVMDDEAVKKVTDDAAAAKRATAGKMVMDAATGEPPASYVAEMKGATAEVAS